MLYPPVAELAAKIGSRYQLVNLVARRAREISARNEKTGCRSDEKPVSIAINEVYAGKLTMIGNTAVKKTDAELAEEALDEAAAAAADDIIAEAQAKALAAAEAEAAFDFDFDI